MGQPRNTNIRNDEIRRPEKASGWELIKDFLPAFDYVPPDDDPVWQYIEDHKEELLKIIAYQCRGRFDLIEEIWCDVVIGRVPRIYDLCPPDVGESHRWYHVRKNVSMYVMKYMNRVHKVSCVRESFEVKEHDQPTGDALAGNLWVKEVLECLELEDRRLIILRVFHELTWKEISAKTGVSLYLLRKQYDRIIEVLSANFTP